jgi:hypothetical protein
VKWRAAVRADALTRDFFGAPAHGTLRKTADRITADIRL